MYARQCSRSWADGSMRQALTLMELAFQWWERKWTSKQKHHAISDYDSSYERRRRTSSSDCCDLLCDMLVLPSAFNLHEDIKVTKALRLPDSWPSFKELGIVKASPPQKKEYSAFGGNHQLEKLEQRIPWKLPSELRSGDADQYNRTEMNVWNWAECKVITDHMPLNLFKYPCIWTTALVKFTAYTCSPQETLPVPSHFRPGSQIRIEMKGSLRHCRWCRSTQSCVHVFGTKAIS